MSTVVVKLVLIILIVCTSRSEASTCPPNWFDCENGRCISKIWLCDGENDCGNFNDEKNCGNATETCIGFLCRNQQCVPPKWYCDGMDDCGDGSDEVLCPKGDKCSADDFQCKNGHCILKSWRCDFRDDCGDNSDEQDCPYAANCSKHEMTCLDGACVPVIWRCDGDNDCPDSSDEMNCNATRCNSDTHFRCDHGKCISTSWICDGTEDCLDGSDEKNCRDKCSADDFQCKNGHCILKSSRCDFRDDCGDNSDEQDCRPKECDANNFRCFNGQCLPTNKRCDGIEDCSDESDEVGCKSECNDFFCAATGRCLHWSLICDGNEDCQATSDEGGLCSTSCAGDNGNCSHTCQKTPQGSKCFCDKGFRLLPDNKTCEDINECQALDACSHYCSNRKGSYKCICAHGYRLHRDNHSCVAEGESATLMYLLKDAIRGLDLETYSSKFHFIVKGANMKGFDFDVTEKEFYWTDVNEESIDSYSTNNNSHVVVYRSCSRPVAVRYDWLARNLYFLDEKSNIGVCTKNRKFCKTLIKSGARRIDSMTISPPFGYMFWTVWARSSRYNLSGIIRRAEMNGSHVLSIVSSELFSPTAITVDHVLEVVYWADIKLKTLECANFHGFKRKRVVESGIHHPVASVVFEDHIYWIERSSNSIMRCHKFIKAKCENVTGGNVKALDLLVAHKVMQPRRNSSKCLVENGGCSHLCLTARKGTTCACLDDTELDVDGRTCLAPKCEENEFRCENGQCIRIDLRCDGKKECNDGSDELNCGT